MCSDNATCFNTIGSYVCQCFDGLTGDGYDCYGKRQFSFVENAKKSIFIYSNYLFMCKLKYIKLQYLNRSNPSKRNII